MASIDNAQEEKSTKGFRFLRKVLAINAISSGAFGLIFILVSNQVSSLLGFEHAFIIMMVGFGLVLFALDIWHQLKQSEFNINRAMGTTLGDVMWVVASIVLVVGYPDMFSGNGRILIALIACWVGLMALMQYVGLKKG